MLVFLMFLQFPFYLFLSIANSTSTEAKTRILFPPNIRDVESHFLKQAILSVYLIIFRPL